MDIQLQFPPAERLTALRRGLQELSYNEESICRRTGLRAIFDFTIEGQAKVPALGDSLDALILLFLCGDGVPEERANALLPADFIAVLAECGLVVQLGSSGEYFGTVQLYPVESLYIVSDRPLPLDGSMASNRPDVVFTAISWNTEQFLACMPRSSCERLLDLCSGSGIAALAHARAAQNAWSCDLAQRSVDFAEFNRRLNGIENVACLQGDLYGPIGDMTFDRIVAHPPYVPAAQQQLLFRDGGDDGEQILRRVIEGLPRHLRAGGMFYAYTMSTDRQEDTLEKRIRRWLGESENQFDVLLVQANIDARKPYEQLADRLKITSAYFTALLIERLQTPRAAVTARTRKSRHAGWDALQWFRVWKQAMTAPGFDEFLLDARPHLAPHFKLTVTHSVSERKLLISQFELLNEYPFGVVVPCPAWVGLMMNLCDGVRTTREICAGLQERIGPELTDAGFVTDLKEMITRGFLELDEFPLPPRPKEVV